MLIVYVLLFPEKAQLVAGWIWKGLSRSFHFADRKAVAHRVEGRINAARKGLLKNVPTGIFEGGLRLKWTSAEQAEALVRDGQVVVCMRRAEHEDANIAHAVMAYLPKALLPRARRYVDRTTMRATDLVIARSLLDQRAELRGALDVFFGEHLDPACSNATVKERVAQIDEIDLQGWLLRVLLAEYRRLGEELHPSFPDDACRSEAADLARWLAKLAARAPGSTDNSLAYKGQFFRVAVIFVAIRGRIESEGFKPYRARAKRYLYRDKYDVVYLMGRDDNMPSVKVLASDLAGDGLVESIDVSEYQLRRDFKARKLNRERAVIATLRRRRAPGEIVALRDIEEDASSLPSETHEFAAQDDASATVPRADSCTTTDSSVEAA